MGTESLSLVRVEGKHQGPWAVDTVEISSFSPQRNTQFCILFPLTLLLRVSTILNNGFGGEVRTGTLGLAPGTKRILQLKREELVCI